MKKDFAKWILEFWDGKVLKVFIRTAANSFSKESERVSFHYGKILHIFYILDYLK